MNTDTPPPTWQPAGHTPARPATVPGGITTYLPSGYPAPATDDGPPHATTPVAGGAVIDGQLVTATQPPPPAPTYPPPAAPANLAATAPGDTRPAAAPPSPRTATRRPGPNRRLLAAGAAAVVALTAITIAITSAASPAPASTVVTAFYTALTNRDTDQLRGLGVCAASPLCDHGALTQGYQPPEHPRIEQPTTGAGSRVGLTVHYQLDGTDHADQIGLTRTRTGLLSSEWRISDPPGAALTLRSSYLTYARVAHADISTSTDRRPATPPPVGVLPSPTTIWAPPGRYTITTPGDQLVDPIKLDLTVTGPAHPQPVELQPTLRGGLDQQITQQIHDRLDLCANQTVFRPATDPSPLVRNSCPFGYTAPYTIAERPHWTINTYPTIELRLEPDGTVTTATTTPGRVTLTYRWTLDILEPRTWTTETLTQPVTVAGHAVIDHDTATWTP